MENSRSKVKYELMITISPETRKGIENHKKAAIHLQNASKSHLDAATYYEVGNHEKAAQSTLNAYGHINLANNAQKENVEQHVINS